MRSASVWQNRDWGINSVESSVQVKIGLPHSLFIWLVSEQTVGLSTVHVIDGMYTG